MANTDADTVHLTILLRMLARPKNSPSDHKNNFSIAHILSLKAVQHVGEKTEAYTVGGET